MGQLMLLIFQGDGEEFQRVKLKSLKVNNMQVEFSTNYEKIILCPYCKGENLHHCKMEGYSDDMVIIDFCCELCKSRPVLTIDQHKGQTFVEWCDIKSREYTGSE